MKVKNSESSDRIGSLISSMITKDMLASIGMEKNQTLAPFRSDLVDVSYSDTVDHELRYIKWIESCRRK